ncbi:hypothetical protein A1353_16950 [Methylomonas methanica]|uniref:Uncharacterized protein n=1 Tax=Methylomonas methanica TaxID=421 RepID=A0A177M980_METMH|nr:hypothetical protein [Methylomonas methanica]OAI02201.1 hypothetical protein A1353_16950 [Methylomonas methanica]
MTELLAAIVGFPILILSISFVTNRNGHPIQKLTRASVLIWLISLCLPGFSITSKTETFYGALILLLGLLFGWMALGLAAYANLFFFKVVSTLNNGKQPKASVIFMLIFASTLPFFPGPIISEGSGATVPVTSWGWGAVLWVVSLAFLVIAAAIQNQWMSVMLAKYCVIAVFGGVLSIVAIRDYQFSVATEQDREAYLTNDMAFTVAPLCEVSINWPERPFLNPDEVIVTDIDPALKPVKGDRPYLNLPTLPNYSEKGFDWITYKGDCYGCLIKVRYPQRANHPILQAKATQEGAIIRLLDKDASTVLYEQRLLKKIWNKGPVYCPRPSGFTDKGYDAAILKAIGHEKIELSDKPMLETEKTEFRCDMGTANIDGIDGLREWDGRHVMLSSESFRSSPSFCSERYLIKVKVEMCEPGGEKDLRAYLAAYERKTFRPLGSFSTRKVCSKRSEIPDNMVKGIQISQEQSTVETTMGKVTAERIRLF